MKVPFFEPFTDHREVEAVSEVIRSHWLTSGPNCQAFENALAEYVGGGVEAIVVNSATAGLHLALEAIGLQPGDEVLVPTLTFTATAEVVRYLGARPILVDSDPVTLNIDLALAATKVGPKTRAIMPVHFAGLPCDMPELAKFAETHNLAVVEDAAHALTAEYAGKKIGDSDNAVSVFSFYANKTMTTGEGGAIVTKDPALAARMRVMRTHGIDRDASNRFKGGSWEYDVVAPGFKYNMTDIAAAMGIVQLDKADQARQLRNDAALVYLELLKDLPLWLPAVAPSDTLHAWHIFPVALLDDFPATREETIEALKQAGIGVSVHYRPLHRMTYWSENWTDADDQFPVADRHYECSLTLPLFPTISREQQQYVADTLKKLALKEI